LTAAATGIVMIAPTTPNRLPPIRATSKTAAEDMLTVLRSTRGAIK
jgi:hypothetical protein